jgi:alkanesulfonate monooxygenase SsuD/methylene tetrahydromethanopterin reductase-like flavin-dependent oxidoreductase (luciferase family)
VIRNVIAEAVLADQVGVDFFGVGEHHRTDFAVSALEIVLAAIAGQTCRIHLGTAVTVLSSDDPIRLFQRVATLDAASSGRAEVILGRGSFTESFPLFGFDLAQYEVLFEDKLDLSQRAHAHFGTEVQLIGVHSPGYIADTDAQVREELWPSYKQMRDRIGHERGWPPMGHADFTQEAERGSLYVGSPETVARKIAATVKALGLARFQLKYSAGPLPHEKLLRSIKLYGTKVIPLVRDMPA